MTWNDDLTLYQTNFRYNCDNHKDRDFENIVGKEKIEIINSVSFSHVFSSFPTKSHPFSHICLQLLQMWMN